jgi:hypothetical protein
LHSIGICVSYSCPSRPVIQSYIPSLTPSLPSISANECSAMRENKRGECGTRVLHTCKMHDKLKDSH